MRSISPVSVEMALPESFGLGLAGRDEVRPLAARAIFFMFLTGRGRILGIASPVCVSPLMFCDTPECLKNWCRVANDAEIASYGL
jgi:hypothetical protein